MLLAQPAIQKAGKPARKANRLAGFPQVSEMVNELSVNSTGKLPVCLLVWFADLSSCRCLLSPGGFPTFMPLLSFVAPTSCLHLCSAIHSVCIMFAGWGKKNLPVTK